MESWLSGIRRTTGNRVYVNSVPRVQILNSPPERNPRRMVLRGFLFVFFIALHAFREKVSEAEIKKRNGGGGFPRSAKGERQIIVRLRRNWKARGHWGR